jgi:hypothetical protein
MIPSNQIQLLEILQGVPAHQNAWICSVYAAIFLEKGIANAICFTSLMLQKMVSHHRH